MTRTLNTDSKARTDYKFSRPQGLSLVKALLRFSRTPLEFLLCAAEYGDIVDLSFGSQVYLFNHPALIEEILSKQNQHCIKDYSYQVMQDLLGNGLLLSHGDTWKYHRRLMQSAFNSDCFADYAAKVVADTNSMLGRWRSGEIRDLHREMSLLTVEVIMQTMFGINDTKTAQEITQSLDKIMLHYFHQAETFYLLPSWLPILGTGQANRAKKRLKEIVDDIVEQRREQTDGDVLSVMLNAKDEAGNKLTNEELRDEVITLLIAGHDTTANALTWTLMLLAQHPEVETKLVAEIKSVLGDRLPTFDDIPQLSYTKMVLQESLRLYPPAWILGRELIEDCNISGHNFDRGTVIYFSQWSVQRSHWFDSPEQFNPDRWADNLEQRLPRCAYFPFGAGARVCIGKAFSMMEATLILTMVLQKFRLTLLPEHPIELLPSFTLRPKQGVEMAIATRLELNSNVE